MNSPDSPGGQPESRVEQPRPPERLDRIELEPHEALLGFHIIETHETPYGPTVILATEIPVEAVAAIAPQDHPDLGFVGGAARYGLAVAMGEQPDPPRDIDVIRISGDRPLPPAWEETRESWHDLNTYMTRRDLTVNEVLLWHQPGEDGGHAYVYATREAIADTLSGVMTPSLFELEQDGRVRSRHAGRAIRFAARARHAGQDASVVLPDIVGHDLWMFDTALQFERAVAGGYEAEYMELCAPFVAIPEDVHTAFDMLAWLQEAVIQEAHDNDRDDPFEFGPETYHRLDPQGFLAKLHEINIREQTGHHETGPDDKSPGLSAPQIRGYNRLIRDPRLSPEDLHPEWKKAT